MRPTPLLCAAFAACTLAATAAAGHVDLTVSACQPGMVTLTLMRPDGTQHQYPIHIPAPMTATQKRDHILNWLVTNTPLPVQAVGAATLRIDSGADGMTQASLNTGSTREMDKLSAVAAPQGSVAFQGFFEPFAQAGQPAIFTAGIVTDVGTLQTQVSSAELNFQTDGPIICQALFQRLAPRAPQYGAQINYAGDRLEIYFDPAYTVTQGGIIFGTNSFGPGCGGSLDLPPSAPPVRPGDLNCDGVVDFFDIDALLQAMFNPAEYALNYPGCDRMAGDMNNDGFVDFFDIDPFLVCIFTGACDR